MFTGRGRTTRAGVGLGVMMMAVTATMVTAPASNAAVKASLGSGYGYAAKVSLFGGRAMSVGPTPTVKLPHHGSATPITASAPSGSVVFGPGTLFSSGPIALSTVGMNGSANTTTSLQTVGGSPFTADSVTASCTASNGGSGSGVVSVANGTVVTATDTSGNPTATVTIPASPAVNTTISGFLYISPTDKETFSFVFNQQMTDKHGSLVVYGAHETLGGPTAVGDLFVGQALCRS